MGDTPDKDNVTYSLDKLFCMTNKYFHKKVKKKNEKKSSPQGPLAVQQPHLMVFLG